MATESEPRLLRSDEFDELTALLDRCFAYERGGMAARFPFVYDPERPERHAVVEVDGEIVSHAACIPESLLVGAGATVDCCGIGGVATAKPHRGDGYMSALLEFWLDRIDADDVSLTELGG
ncbi:MAG: GNAT family N-acetyltransferase, partial [Halalkalicoccus sp.]|nr:GNAT family N-acetyltransferase [Halalkalicoccus sp.]